MSKVTIATEWLAACAGCHMSLLDIDEKILQLIELVDFDKSPIDDIKNQTLGYLTILQWKSLVKQIYSFR